MLYIIYIILYYIDINIFKQPLIPMTGTIFEDPRLGTVFEDLRSAYDVRQWGCQRPCNQCIHVPVETQQLYPFGKEL